MNNWDSRNKVQPHGLFLWTRRVEAGYVMPLLRDIRNRGGESLYILGSEVGVATLPNSSHLRVRTYGHASQDAVDEPHAPRIEIGRHARRVP